MTSLLFRRSAWKDSQRPATELPIGNLSKVQLILQLSTQMSMFFGWRLLDTKLSLKFFVNFLPSLYSADIDVAALYSYSPFDQFHKTIGYYTPTLSNDQSNSSNVKYDITATANSYSSFSSHVHCEFIRLLLLWHSVYL